MRRAVQIGFAVTAIALVGIGVSKNTSGAFVFFFLVGFGYFLATTSMTAVLQTYLEPHQRGRILAVWFMCFGGVVPVGTLVFSRFVDEFGARWLILFGGAVSGFLAYWCDLVRVERVTET
jgi:MFS family permease